MGLFSGIASAFSAINPALALGAVTSLADPLAQYFGQQDTNKTNAGIAAGANATSLEESEAQMAMEKDFAQNGISWRIADAAKNGISPLAALGASEPSYSPVVPVMDTPSYTSPLSAASAGIGEFGQNLSRALTATRSPTQQASDALDLSMKQKQDDLLGVQLAGAKLSLARQSNPPGLPLAYRVVQNADGSTSRVESPDAIHGGFGGNLLWSLDNKFIPSLQEMSGSGDNSGVDMSYNPE